MLPDDFQSPASKYSYKLPADYTMKPEHRHKLDELVTRTGISNADAKAFVDLHIELTEDFVDNLMPLIKALVIRRILFWFIVMLIANVAAALIIHL